jgi:hypothetical protein
MEDIKRVLESQGNTHNKVEIQSNSELWSLTLSPTQSRTTLHMTHLTSHLDDLHVHGKIKR